MKIELYEVSFTTPWSVENPIESNRHPAAKTSRITWIHESDEINEIQIVNHGKTIGKQ